MSSLCATNSAFCILRPPDLPGLGVRALHLAGQAHKPAIRLPGNRSRKNVGLPGLNERKAFIRPLLGAHLADAGELHGPRGDPDAPHQSRFVVLKDLLALEGELWD